MTELTAGDRLPQIAVPPPGPESRRLAAELRAHESPNITFISDDSPIVWREAAGANVLDVDGNIYIDLTAGFGVAMAGHRNPRVASALRAQSERLIHGLGDVHPAEVKIQLLAKLAAIAPGELGTTILASSGAEAVEAALKTARLASGRPGVLCFSGAYHGLTYGALAVTDGESFRAPFADQLGIPTVRAPYPDPYRPPPELDPSDLAGSALQLLRSKLDRAGEAIGAAIIEPILGRGGVVVPPPGFLSELSDECRRRRIILIFDEIFTGMGRTGRWFACEHEELVPDLLCIGKGLSGAFPLSACIGLPEVMAAWPASDGEAIHTSTFLGHPLSCAAALAQIQEIEGTGLLARASVLGERIHARLLDMASHLDVVGDVRGRGLLAGIELIRDAESREPDAALSKQVIASGLRRGLILLAAGRRGNVLSLSPPLSITEEQLDFALEMLEVCLAEP